MEGKQRKGSMMMTDSTTGIREFEITIPKDDLTDLRDRLARSRFAPDIPGAGWTYGTPTSYLQELVAYWKDSYDWREAERALNRYPQFLTTVDGQQVHFIHVRSRHERAVPLVLLHGFPGSVLEFLQLIEPLTDPESHGGRPEDAFHLVIPSLPGTGFSGPTSEQGWDTDRMAEAIAEVMRRLGYDRYAVQGGDMGQFVACSLGRQHPEHVIGVHVNAATYGFIPWGELSGDELASLTDAERERIDRLNHFNSEGSGYFQIQATRPQTIAAGLSDSPVGQLAWIVDLFKEWTLPIDGGEDIPVDRDTLLTNVMIYWLTNTSASAARVYYENMHSGKWDPPSEVPTGVAVFARDIAIRRYAEQAYHIVHWSEFDRGGHFAALEAPDLLVQDIRAFLRSLSTS
jgi:pimeloyl-ACP methyl ester carboxylesterase